MVSAIKFLRSSVLLSCPQKQKKPAAAPNVGAILGEAADVVVGKYANSGGHASSPYLNRLSEIQIQDEAHIYQQLVKPEEGARGVPASHPGCPAHLCEAAG
jgi:hypothetical protein